MNEIDFPPNIPFFFVRCKKRLIDIIDGSLFSEYGQFPTIDAILDDLREKMLAVELRDDDD